MKTLHQLAECIAQKKAEGKKIVHCHGVFDLLHIGHIRYLKQARSLGDLLVVTVTPDRFVNKGPHRPAFTEKLRAEALLALDGVDEVAINEWPTAVETIRLLKPDIFAKGAEFRDKPTPEILREKEAIREVGGKLAYIEDLTSSSSYLLNKYFSPFDDEVDEYLVNFAEKYPMAHLMRFLDGAEKLKVLVVGETIVEEYHYCATLGQSAKAPILAVQYLSDEWFVGGAASLANNLAGFCRQVDFISLLGEINSEETWIRERLRNNIQAEFIYKPNAPTVRRRRYRESYFSLPVLEVHIMDHAPLPPSMDRVFCETLNMRLPDYDLVVVSDNGYTLLSENAVRLLCERAQFLAVNTPTSPGNLGYLSVSRYPRLNYVCMAENELQLEYRCTTGDAKTAIRTVAGKLNADRLIATFGSQGCLGYTLHDGAFAHAPALATRVVDRVAAGNAFLAVTALCAVQNAPMEIITFMGNVAGAQAVAHVGTKVPLERLAFTRHIGTLLKWTEPESFAPIQGNESNLPV